MSDDIFDYFGGKSPRKVEPLEEDDFFGDLISKDDTENPPAVEPIADEAPVVAADDTKPKEQAKTSGQPQTGSGRVSAANKSENKIEQPETAAAATGGGGSHWDSIASSFGLASPEPKPAQEPEPDNIIAAEEVELVSDDEPATSSNSPVDSLFEAGSDDQDNVGQDEVLSEIFAADQPEDKRPERATSKSVASSATNMPADDDPFAAFHQVPESESTETEDVADSAELEEEEDTLVVTDDFVEFDVKDLNSGKPEPRKRKRRRERKPADRSEGDSETREVKSRGERGRGKGRNQGDRNQGDRNQGDRNQGDRDQGGRGDRSRGKRNEKSRGDRDERIQEGRGHSDHNQEEHDEGSEGRRGERGGRGRGRGGSDRPARRKRPEREGVSESRERGQGRGADRAVAEDDDLSEGEGKRPKRPKVPTWEDAIGSVVEKNIRRHGSNKSDSGRRGGGRRRR